MPLDLHVYSLTDQHGIPRRVLSPLAPEQLGEHALPEAAVLGHFTGTTDELTRRTFEVNPVFVAFVHWVVSTHGPELTELQEAARAHGEGHVAVVDRRTRGGKFSVPPQDVLGTFDVHGGRVTHYRINPDYQLVSDDGLMDLDDALTAELVRALVIMASPEDTQR